MRVSFGGGNRFGLLENMQMIFTFGNSVNVDRLWVPIFSEIE